MSGAGNPGGGGEHGHAPSLAQRILRETASFAALQTFASILAWLVAMAMARLLDKPDFGVYSICSFWIGAGALLGDGGLGATLLRRKEGVSEQEYRVTLTALLALSSTLCAAVYLAAPWIGARNHFTPRDVWVLRAMAPLYLLGALRVVPYIRLERALEFSRIARIELTASLARHAVAIVIGACKGGVWALAVSNVVSATLQLALAYRAAPGWVGLGFSWRVFRPLIAYGSKVQALGVLGFFKDRVSPALLGTVLGPAAVGVFDFGLNYIQVPVTAVNALARVQLPVYARLGPRDPTLHAALRGAMRTATLLGVPLLCALALGAPTIIPTLYSPKWAPAYPVVWGLLANMAGGLSASPLFTLLQGQGRAGLAIGIFTGWTLSTWALAVASVAFFPGDLGMVAAAHSVVTVAVVAGLTLWAGRLLGRGLFGALVGPLLAGAAALSAGFGAQRWVTGVAGSPVGAAGVAVLAYAATLLALEGRTVIDEVRAVIAGVTRKSAPTPAAEPAGDERKAA